jgi:hypothetical protein
MTAPTGTSPLAAAARASANAASIYVRKTMPLDARSTTARQDRLMQGADEMPGATDQRVNSHVLLGLMRPLGVGFLSETCRSSVSQISARSVIWQDERAVR